MRIHDVAGTVGPGQNTLTLDTDGIGGSFHAQGIVAASLSTGAADHLVFSTQPVGGPAGIVLVPAVTIVDIGGHVITTDDRTITLLASDDPGGGPLLGTTQLATTNGVATWQTADALHLDIPGDGYVLGASHDGAPFLSSDDVDSAPFDLAPSRAVPVALTSAVVKPGGAVKLVADGIFPLPDRTTDDLRAHGGTLTVGGTGWSVVFPLPARGWQGLGPHHDGSQGFRFHGVVCTSVIVKAAKLTATCRLETGTFALPEPGPVGVELAVGVGRARYCGSCGGTPSGDATKAFTRKLCAAPPQCP